MDMNTAASTAIVNAINPALIGQEKALELTEKLQAIGKKLVDVITYVGGETELRGKAHNVITEILGHADFQTIVYFEKAMENRKVLLQASGMITPVIFTMNGLDGEVKVVNAIGTTETTDLRFEKAYQVFEQVKLAFKNATGIDAHSAWNLTNAIAQKVYGEVVDFHLVFKTGEDFLIGLNHDDHFLVANNDGMVIEVLNMVNGNYNAKILKDGERKFITDGMKANAAEVAFNLPKIDELTEQIAKAMNLTTTKTTLDETVKKILIKVYGEEKAKEIDILVIWHDTAVHNRMIVAKADGLLYTINAFGHAGGIKMMEDGRLNVTNIYYGKQALMKPVTENGIIEA